jgi:hypothetical protein
MVGSGMNGVGWMGLTFLVVGVMAKAPKYALGL